MTSIAESRGRRLKTNVIDYRPLTAPLMSPKMYSRPTSPLSIKSPKFPKEQVYKSKLEHTQLDMDKLLENLPKNFTKKQDPSRLRTKNVTVSNPPLSSRFPTSRREENSIELHTKRIGFQQQQESSATNKNLNLNTLSSNILKAAPKKPWRNGGSSITTPCTSPSRQSSHLNFSTQNRFLNVLDAENNNCDETNDEDFGIKKKLTKRPCTAGGFEKKEVTMERETKKDVFLRHVTVVNGSVVTFKSFGYENFPNWFGDESVLFNSKEKKSDFFHREVNLCGFTNREISLKLFCGNKMIIEANRPARGKLAAKKFKETIILPNHLSVESIIVCRTRSGRLIIQEISKNLF